MIKEDNLSTSHHPAPDYWDKFAGWALPLFVILAFLFWGARTLWDTSEARYGQAAFEMLSSGNWLVPTLGNAPHLTKPPLTYWLTGLGLKLFGVNAWGARFFLSAAFFITILLVRELASTMGFDRRQSLAAALIYATAAIPFAAGHTLTTDGYLVLWETLGVLAVWKIWRGDEKGISTWRFLFWLAFALAFLTKGPPGWLPLLAIAVFHFLRRNKLEGRRIFSPLSFIIFLLVSFSWYGFIILRQHQMLGYFLEDEVYRRIFTSTHHRNAPFWIYLPVLLIGVGPWLILWPWLFKRAWRYLTVKADRFHDWQFFLILWVALPLAVFTIAKSRLVFYVLPLFVPIALGMGPVLVGDLLPRLRVSARWRRSTMVISIVWGAILILSTTSLDLVAKDRSLRSAAAIFNEKIARMPGSHPCFWVWGSQPYSLPFYMHRILRDADSLTPEPDGAYSGLTTPLYIGKYAIFQRLSRQGHLTEGKRRALVLAVSQGCVLFALEPQPENEVRKPAPAVPGGSP